MRGIVVGVNASEESDEALDWALAEAAARGVPLTAVLACQPPSRNAEQAEVTSELDRRREEVRAVLDRARERTGVDGETAADVGQGPAADVLLTVAEDADMLVLGRRRRGRLGRAILGSVSSTVVEHVTVPVTVVRGRGRAGAARAEPEARTGENPAVGAADEDASSSSPSRVVVGVDTSAPSVAALRHAGEVAARTGAVLEVIFAWQITTLAPLPGSWGWAPPLDEYEGFAGQCLDATVEKAGVRLPPDRLRRSLVHGRAAASLLEASRTAERVVVGARGLGGFDRLLLGSVSRQVLDYAACPVTVVRA